MAVIIADITITAQIYKVIICLQKFFSFYTFFNVGKMRIILHIFKVSNSIIPQSLFLYEFNNLK